MTAATATEWALTIRVVGHEPHQQGSMAIRYDKGRRPFVAHDDSAALKRWRREIGEAADSARAALGGWLTLTVPTVVDVTFFVARGSTVRRPFPSVAPDLDKYERACLDALTQCGVVKDDALVCDLASRKRYADDRPVGATIRVRPLDGVLL